MALTEKEFSMIKKKMDKIDQRLDELIKTGTQNMETLLPKKNVKE